VPFSPLAANRGGLNLKEVARLTPGANDSTGSGPLGDARCAEQNYVSVLKGRGQGPSVFSITEGVDLG
jgi:hypothetical protein